MGLYLVAQDDCLAYKGPFFRLVREMHNGLPWDRSFPSQALGRLKTVCESYLIRLLIDARMCAVHAMRMTIFPKDISLVLRIRQEKDDFDPMFHRPSASRSRREKFQSILEDAVMDVGAGSGISSFFAAQAGASKVYAVEASNASEVIRTLAAAPTNASFGQQVTVVPRLLETISDAEVPRSSVDVLVSEPIGTLLFNERMIETYLRARDRFLKPGGKMFPNAATLFVAPFSDQVLWDEERNRGSFWKQKFYDIDMSPAKKRLTPN